MDRRIIRGAVKRSPLSAFSRLDEWRNPELLKDAEVLVPGFERFMVRAKSDDLFHLLPASEPEVVSVLRHYLREGSVFLDAGANIGFFTVLASKLVGQSGTVLAVEMMPDTAAILRKHVALNRCENVKIIEAAHPRRKGTG
jgi:tRNA/tmRNA/rRNA uracil-C5-methylase (TrmA/RlmC/RlmD family)